MIKKIIIGSANFNQIYGLKKNRINKSEIKILIKLAKKNGINKIDTSPSYKNSEKLIGTLKHKNLQITTKIPKIPKKISTKQVKIWVSKMIINSLKNLKVKRINCILIQNSDVLLSKKGLFIYDTLKKFKNDKKISKIGISIYDFKNLNTILNKFKIDLVQVPLNIFDQRLIKTGWINKFRKKNIEVQVRSIFLQGLLFLRSHQLPKRFKQYNFIWKKWEKWQIENKSTPLQGCLSLVKKYPQIKGIVIGFNNSEQLKNILKIKNFISKTPSITIKNQNIFNRIKW